MKIIESSYDKEIVLALGMFDSVHRGHTHLILKAQEIAEKYGCECAVFTFKNNPYAYFGHNLKMVYTFEERVKILKDLGIDLIVAKEMNENYALTSPEDFLKGIFSDYNIKAVVCGSDYTFGYKGNGNIEMLTKYANNNGINVRIVDFLTHSGKKISSSTIREYIANGNIENANNLIGRPYFISGQVISCHGRGKKYGFPTANIIISDEKLQLKQGVYATSVEVDGKIYKSLTNIGEKPTFNDYSLTVESFLQNFNGNLYGKEITVKFFKKIRDIIKFNNEQELYNQIIKDVEVSDNLQRTI